VSFVFGQPDRNVVAANTISIPGFHPLTRAQPKSIGSFSSACPQHVRQVNLGNADCPALPIEGIGLEVIQTAQDRTTLRASDAEQRDRPMRSLSSGALARPVGIDGRTLHRVRDMREFAFYVVW
jgi:hypothetical protein